jgi:hypothetical protein
VRVGGGNGSGSGSKLGLDPWTLVATAVLLQEMVQDAAGESVRE